MCSSDTAAATSAGNDDKSCAAMQHIGRLWLCRIFNSRQRSVPVNGKHQAGCVQRYLELESNWHMRDGMALKSYCVCEHIWRQEMISCRLTIRAGASDNDIILWANTSATLNACTCSRSVTLTDHQQPGQQLHLQHHTCESSSSCGRLAAVTCSGGAPSSSTQAGLMTPPSSVALCKEVSRSLVKSIVDTCKQSQFTND